MLEHVVTPGNNQKRFLAGALNVRTGKRIHRCRTMAQLMVWVHAYLDAGNKHRSACPFLRRADLKRAS